MLSAMISLMASVSLSFCSVEQQKEYAKAIIDNRKYQCLILEDYLDLLWHAINGHCFQANKFFFGLTLALMMCMQATVKSSTQRIFRHLLKSITCTWKPFLKSKANKCCSKFVRGSPQKSRSCMHNRKANKTTQWLLKASALGLSEGITWLPEHIYILYLYLYILHI